MWLLHTTTGELRWFSSIQRVRYAILSHVWTVHEDDFQHIRSGGLAHATDKVKRFCEFARARGYEWAWVDTCCIDKTSSAELSEAINSMFQWYQSASECVAFLADVPENEDPISINSAFRRSRWFTRGWTLQELIAPREVLFLGDHWHILGSKHSMRVTVDEITGVAADVLTHVTSVDAISVAERMSWAAQRNTTRVEDEAYSLMGLFGVFMPTVYGEGRSAFIRLQEEILRTIADDSLFTWGPLAIHTNMRRRVRDAPTVTIFGTPWEEECEQLFAVSPRQFAGCYGIVSLSAEEFVHSLHRLRYLGALTSTGLDRRAGTPGWSMSTLALSTCEYTRNHFTITSHSVRAHMPIGYFEGTVAILACCTSAKGYDVIGLALTRMAAEDGRYHVGNASGGTARWRILRIPLWFNPISNGIRLQAYMKETTIVYRQTRHLQDKTPPLLRVSYWPRCEILVAPWTCYALLNQGFHLSLFTTSRRPLEVAVPEPIVFAPITEPPRFKLSQLTGSFAALCLTHPTHAASIEIVIKPCSALFHTPDRSVPFHLYAAVTKPKAHANDKDMSLSSPRSSDLHYPEAIEPCAGIHETGKCTVRKLRLEELQEFAASEHSPWVVQISCQRICRGDMDMYSLAIGTRELTGVQVDEARTSTPGGAGESESSPPSQRVNDSVPEGGTHSDVSLHRPDIHPVGGENGVHEGGCTQPATGAQLTVGRPTSTRNSDTRKGVLWKRLGLFRKKA